MPELPEVETIARGLAKRVTGDVITSVWLGSKPEPLKSSAQEIVKALEGKRIAGVRRVGKHIVIDLESAAPEGKPRKRGKSKHAKTPRLAKEPSGNETAQWIVHLGMTGRLL